MQRGMTRLAGLRGLILCLLVTAAAGMSSRTLLRVKQVARSFIRSLEFRQVLRICNAYPYTAALDVYLGKTKLSDAPLAYKACGEYMPKLQVGDELDFKVEDTSAGTFTISDVPENDAVLLMVIYRHDPVSTAVSFESHVFANLRSAQIAVLDTYKGTAKSELHIQDRNKQVHMRSELLQYDNVVAVDPGAYEVLLKDVKGNTTKANTELIALSRESYVIVRCGVEAQIGTAYPQDILVYPRSDKAMLGAAAPGAAPCGIAVLGLLLLTMIGVAA